MRLPKILRPNSGVSVSARFSENSASVRVRQGGGNPLSGFFSSRSGSNRMHLIDRSASIHLNEDTLNELAAFVILSGIFLLVFALILEALCHLFVYLSS